MCVHSTERTHWNDENEHLETIENSQHGNLSCDILGHYHIVVSKIIKT